MPFLIRQAQPHPSRDGHQGSLWLGGADDVISDDGYDVIILCADEFQPAAHIIARPGVQVVHAPNDDSESPLTRDQATTAIAASRVAARAFKKGKKVLVSCMQGRNRSGLVMALTLHRLYGMAGERCRTYIRAKRPHALTNPSFNAFLDSIKARAA
jgi:hypothetical protein